MFSFGDAFLAEESLDAETHLVPGTTIHEEHHKDSPEHQEHHEDDNHEHTNDTDCDDECHFCICSCTSHNIILESYKLTPVRFDISKSKISTAYTSIYNNRYLDNIFQPPQA